MRGQLQCSIRSGPLTLLIALQLSGCAQMTRHSNTMIFGTNTKVALDVGVDATSTPSITLGYKRQEAVIMPLVANVDKDGKMIPCAATDANGAKVCLLVGERYTANNMPIAKDTYSVLASFGAKFDANISGQNPEASGGLAQYFATGIAAQFLAVNGGAAVLAVGSAAQQAAQSNPAKDAAIAAIATGDSKAAAQIAQVAAQGQTEIDAYELKTLKCLRDDSAKVNLTTAVTGDLNSSPDSLARWNDFVSGKGAFSDFWLGLDSTRVPTLKDAINKACGG